MREGSLTKITDRRTGERIVTEEEPSAFTRIAISIFGMGIHSYWTLDNLYPNGFITGAFLRSFIVQGLAIHSKEFASGRPIPLKLTDSCTLRELYWLEKG